MSNVAEEKRSSLAEQIEEHRRTLWRVNTREQAVEWCATADELMRKAVNALKQAAGRGEAI